MKPYSDIDALILKYIREEWLSDDEGAELRQWLTESVDRKELIERLTSDPDWVKSEIIRMKEIRTEAIWSKVESRLKSLAPIPHTPQTGRRRWFYTAAASFILILGSASALLWFSRSHRPGTVAGNKAFLTLSNGRQIDIGTAANSVIADQGSQKVAHLSDSQIVYTNEKVAEDQLHPTAYHTLTTPRSGQFKLSLPDGTQVWLNNASALRYPVSFIGLERTVELNGEAYFEVAKDAAHPFRVKVAAGELVEVLGTSFNVMAYGDEPVERTTLIVGIVRVIDNNQTALLQAAGQSALDNHGKLSVALDVNAQQAIAWKNGYFHFDHTSLQATMRQLARWYDIDVIYQGTPPRHEFVGRIQRSLPLSGILKGLEDDDVHFKLDGRRLLVTP